MRIMQPNTISTESHPDFGLRGVARGRLAHSADLCILHVRSEFNIRAYKI